MQMLDLTDEELGDAIVRHDLHYLVIRSELINENGKDFMFTTNKAGAKLIVFNCLRDNYNWIGRGEKHLHWYNGIIYEEISESTFCGMIDQLYTAIGWSSFFDTLSAHHMYDRLINMNILDSDQLLELNNYPDLVPFTNGIYSRHLHALVPPDPKYFFTACFMVPYTSDVNCVEFQAFLEKILPDISLRLRILAYLSYLMSPRIDKKLAQFWVGDGDNGKTELTKIVYLIMGKFVQFVDMDVLMDKAKNRFATSDLENTWANLGSEINHNSMSADGISLFKRLTGNNRIRIEEKHEKPRNVTNMCKHLFDVNEFPLPSGYFDKAAWNRVDIIPFTICIPDEEQVPNLMDLIFEQEGPQIASMLVNFDENIDAHLQKNPVRAETDWSIWTQSVFMFYIHCCKDGAQEQQSLYFEYEEICGILGRRVESLSKFTRLLKAMGVNKYREGADGEQLWFYSCEVYEPHVTKLMELTGKQRYEE